MTKRNRNKLLPLIALIIFTLGFESGGFQLVLIHIASEFQLDNTMMGALVSAQYVAILAMPILFGYISDRVGKKRVLIVALPIFIAGCVLAALSHSAGFFILAAFVMGTGFSASESIASAALSDSDPLNAERNLNLTQAAFSLGGVISPLLVNRLMHMGSTWRIVFVLSAAIHIVLLPILINTKFTRGEIPGEMGEHKKQPVLNVIKSPVLILLVGMIILYAASENGMGYFMESFFTVELNTPDIGAYALSFFWAMMAITRLIFGVIKTNVYKTLVVFNVIIAVLVGILALVQNPILAVVICALLGAASGPVWPFIVGLGTSRFLENTGLVTSIFMMGSGAGSTLAPILLGAMADTAGLRWSIGLVVIFAAAAAALGTVLLIKHNKNGSAAKEQAI